MPLAQTPDALIDFHIATLAAGFKVGGKAAHLQFP
jgi:hypothetical protein